MQQKSSMGLTEPVDRIDQALKNIEERIDDPVLLSILSVLEICRSKVLKSYREPLGVIHLVRAEQSVQRVVARDDEAGEVDKEFSSNIEEDQEEVETGQGEEDVDLGDAGLLLEVVEHFISGELHRIRQPQVSTRKLDIIVIKQRITCLC